MDERNLETDQATASLSENSEISLQGSAYSLETAANIEQQSSPNDGNTTPASDQRTEPFPQLPPSPEKPEKLSSHTRRSHISTIKPNPVLRRTSRLSHSKTQSEVLKECLGINAPAPSSSETIRIPSAAEVNKSELSQCLSNEICEEKVTKAAAGSQENRDSNGMKHSLEPTTANETLSPGRTSESTDSVLDRPASLASVSELNPVKDSAVTQTRRSRFQKARPNLPMTPRPARLKSQTAQESKSTPDLLQKSTETDISPAGEKVLTTKSQNLAFDSVTSEKKNNPERMVQLHSNVATADQIASDKEHAQDATTELSSLSESTEEQINSHLGKVETPLGAPFRDIRDHSASADIITEAPGVCQRKETEYFSTSPVRTTRFQKVKPKPNLLATSSRARSNAISARNTVIANCDPPSNPQSQEETAGEVTKPEMASPVTGPGSGPIPMPDASSSLTATESLTVTEAEQTDVGVEANMKPSVDQSTSVTKDIPVQSEEHGAKATAPTPKTGGELSEMVASAGVMSPPTQESHPPPSNDLPVSQEEVSATCPPRKDRKVKHKPALSKPQSTEEPVAAPPVEKSSNPGPHYCLISPSQKDQTSGAAPAQTPSQSHETSATSEPCSTGTPTKNASLAENQGENIESTESSAKNDPQRRRRVARAKPKLGSSTRNTPAKPHPSNGRNASEQHPVGTTVTLEQHAQTALQPAQQASEQSMSTKMSRDDQINEAMTSDSVALARQASAEKQSARPESNTPASGDAADISKGQGSGNVTAETEMKMASVDPSSCVKDRPQQAQSEGRGSDTGSSEDRSLLQR